MKTRIVLSSLLIVVLLSSLFVPLASAQGSATDDVGADQQSPQWTKRPVYLTLDPAPAGSTVAAPWKPDAAVTLVLDDGSAENYLGVNDGIDGTQFLWVNRFTPDPADFPFDLQEISVVFGSTGVAVGDPVQLLVYEDTDGDGDPTNASLVAAINETVQVTGGNNWSNYTLDTPATLNGPGDVLIGVINRYQLGVGLDYPAAIDAGASQYRSWAGWWNTDIAPDPPYLPPDAAWGIIDDFGFAGNWMVRGAGETVGELTMHVQGISGWFFMDPNGFPILRALVQAADQDDMPLSGVLVDATIAVPGKNDAMRSRYTHVNGWARFWAPAFGPGTYELCVDNLTLEGYTYSPDDNVVTCMEWTR